MRIGIDARLYGLENAGLGRYVTELVKNLLLQDKKNHYVLFLNSKHALEYRGRKRVSVVVTDVPIYSLAEQLSLPYVFARQNLDLLHVPHFNAPLLYPGKLLLTVHDLIKHDSTGPDTTTRNRYLYALKHLAYLLLTKLIAHKATHILVPSEFVKNDVSHRLKVAKDKITVTYEASSNSLKEVDIDSSARKKILNKYRLSQPFVVYTGSVYPHKNVEMLIEAVKEHNSHREVDLMLAIICSRSVFWERLNKKITAQNLQSFVKLLGFLPDDEVSQIYNLALALVHPSKMEGFGLTGLEAMQVGLPVLSSNASCLPEIYADAALYFDPNNVADLVSSLEKIIGSQEVREELMVKGYQRSRAFSWKKMAEDTLVVYRQLLKS